MTARPSALVLLGLILALPLAARSQEVPAVELDEPFAGVAAGEPVAVGDAARGRAHVARLGCGVCHTIPRMPGAIGIVGPPLGGIAERALLAGTLPNRPEVLVRFLHDPPGLVPNTGMPRLPLSEQEARDIAAYLATLR